MDLEDTLKRIAQFRCEQSKTPSHTSFSFTNQEGQKIYELAAQLNNEMVSLHDDVLYSVFTDIDYYAIVGYSPMIIRDGGHSQESAMSKDLFEKWVKVNNNYLTNKFLYYHDLEALVNAIQNRFSIIISMLDSLYHKLSPSLLDHIRDYEEVGFSQDVETYAMLNTIIINVSSSCDLLTKLAYELTNISNVSFDKYPKLLSKDVLFSSSKRLPEDLRLNGTIFEAHRPKVIQEFDSLRNEIVHNGSLDFYYNVYYGIKENQCYAWILMPEFDNTGNLQTYNGRKKFYPDCNRTFNTFLPLMLKEYLTLTLKTIQTLRKKFSSSRYDSPEDVKKFYKEIINWKLSFYNLAYPQGDTTKGNIHSINSKES